MGAQTGMRALVSWSSPSKIWMRLAKPFWDLILGIGCTTHMFEPIFVGIGMLTENTIWIG